MLIFSRLTFRSLPLPVYQAQIIKPSGRLGKRLIIVAFTRASARNRACAWVESELACLDADVSATHTNLPQNLNVKATW